MPNNEHSFILATMQIGRDDAGGGSLTSLTGKAVPIVRWEDVGQSGREPPIVAMYVVSAVRNRGAPEKLEMSVQMDAVVPDASEGLEVILADRLEEVLTTAAYAAKGLDLTLTSSSRTDNGGLEEGRRRITVEFHASMKR
jgi:hypothetical protein